MRVVPPKKGEPLVNVAGRYKTGLIKANAKLNAWDEWHKRLQLSFANGTPAPPLPKVLR